MANVSHASLTGADLHEPKGAASANAGGIYVADGVGSGSWQLIPMGGQYVTSGTTETINVQETGSLANFVKISASTWAETASNSEVSNATQNRLLYTGTKTKHFHVVAQATLAPSAGTNQLLEIGVYHYDASGASGSILTHSVARINLGTTAEGQITTHADIMLDTNDYLELHCANTSSTNDIDITYAYIFAMGIPTTG